ncbi:MAG: 2Fe-2S iron-sulfur cluster-binding protein [Spirochaetia bacterium]|nr:2Fe-2S iron-sulfur cluster-binding protein [Spirochaetia bacterium]
MGTNEKISVQVMDTNHTWKEIKAESGSILMRAITGAKMDMEASCDGECACSTCHVYIDPQWLQYLPAPEDEELMMIDYTDKPAKNSRLACQIKLSPELNGMKVTIIGK